jgi:hypothetical protein
MKLDEEYVKNLQPKITECLKDFALCKKEIISSRELITQDIEDSNIWMRYRNALDRLATVQLAIQEGEFPPKSNFEILEADTPEKVLEYSSYLFRNTAVEAWVQAAALMVGILRMRIDSMAWYGDKVLALSNLEEAINIEAEARLTRSVSVESTISKYKQVVVRANKGLGLLKQEGPYTRWSLIFLILTIIVIIAIEIWRWERGV